VTENLFLPLKPIKRIMRSAGADRLSQQALTLMGNCLIEYCKKLTAEAVMLQKHSKRSTLQADDVELAQQRVS